MAGDVLGLTHVLAHHGSMSQSVKRRVRAILVPALGRSHYGRTRRRLQAHHSPIAVPGRGPGTAPIWSPTG